jgi:hypothetical protein
MTERAKLNIDVSSQVSRQPLQYIHRPVTKNAFVIILFSRHNLMHNHMRGGYGGVQALLDKDFRMAARTFFAKLGRTSIMQGYDIFLFSSSSFLFFITRKGIGNAGKQIQPHQ